VGATERDARPKATDFLVTEFSIEHPPGSLMGELGFPTPNNRRMATIECIEAGHVLTIEYDKLLEIYSQNPEFGLLFPHPHDPAPAGE